jgi:hypothetical protein
MSMNQVVAGWNPDPDSKPSDRLWRLGATTCLMKA